MPQSVCVEVKGHLLESALSLQGGIWGIELRVAQQGHLLTEPALETPIF